jgi:hypothetical protein
VLRVEPREPLASGDRRQLHGVHLRRCQPAGRLCQRVAQRLEVHVPHAMHHPRVSASELQLEDVRALDVGRRDAAGGLLAGGDHSVDEQHEVSEDPAPVGRDAAGGVLGAVVGGREGHGIARQRVAVGVAAEAAVVHHQRRLRRVERHRGTMVPRWTVRGRGRGSAEQCDRHCGAQRPADHDDPPSPCGG